VRSYSLSVSKARLRVRRGTVSTIERLLVSGQWPPNSDSEEQSSRQPSATRATVDLNSDRRPQRILLVPVSSIAGIVLDENGEPIAGALVQGIAVKTSLDGPDYVSVRSYHTDDRGGYALLSLPPGDYVVRNGRRSLIHALLLR